MVVVVVVRVLACKLAQHHFCHHALTAGVPGGWVWGVCGGGGVRGGCATPLGCIEASHA
jgi:hypothetical protein